MEAAIWVKAFAFVLLNKRWPQAPAEQRAELPDSSRPPVRDEDLGVRAPTTRQGDEQPEHETKALGRLNCGFHGFGQFVRASRVGKCASECTAHS